MANPRTIAMVPHTHWDREWYQPFQGFRLRLVELLDEFLPRLDADPAYARFMLDGQMAVVDDYLAVRPEREETLRRLAASGRLAVGPWYILMDEFLVSGETIIRNLQLGLERATAFGGGMSVGYLPDMFGHIAQMPQLLRLAGFQHAVVWRGVPAAIDRTGFWWGAPDGSTVRAEYLPVGYGNGAAVPDDAKALVRRIAAHEAELGSLLGNEPNALLWMNGTDHQTPQPWLGRVVAEANASQDDYHLIITSLPEYLASASTVDLPSWTGELRSGARANLLMGVASNRVDVRRAAAGAERALERQAEPLCAIWLPADQWPDAELKLAWLEVIRNSAHDSICACSADDVTLAVLDRFAQATTLADGLRRRTLEVAGATMASTGPVIINSSARRRGGVVELVLAGDQVIPGAQVLEQVSAGTAEASGVGRDLGVLLGQLAAQGYRVDRSPIGIDLDAGDTGVELTVRTGRGRPPFTGGPPVMSEAYAQAGAHRDQPVHIKVERAASQRVAVHVADVPGFGWAAWEPGPLSVPPVTGAATVLDNGLVNVDVDPALGTFTLNGVSGLNRLVDDGDEGDTYNYSPPAFDSQVDQPASVGVELIESGPVRGRLRVRRTYRWPAAVADGRRVGEETVVVVSDLEVRAGEPFVRVTTTFDNRCRDHRVRAWFPLPRPASSSRAESAFAIVERGLTAEGGPQERGLPTYPAQRFVAAGGLTVTHDRLLEYELSEDGAALAMTLLRATGMLSRPHPAFRPNSAGPALPVEGPQLQGPVSVSYAVHVGDADPYELADRAWLPLEVTGGGGDGWRPSTGTDLTVTGAEVSSLRRVAGALELRVFNPTDQDTTVLVENRAGWLVDLRGRALEPFEGSFPLGPWAIATARF